MQKLIGFKWKLQSKKKTKRLCLFSKEVEPEEIYGGSKLEREFA